LNSTAGRRRLIRLNVGLVVVVLIGAAWCPMCIGMSSAKLCRIVSCGAHICR
jgi:hypothetical protein